MIRVFGALLGWLAGGLLRLRRRHVEDAMRRAGVGDPTRAAAAMYASLGAGVFEVLARALGRPRPRVGLDPASEAAWAAALADGPVVVAASHTGNWELAAAWLAERTPSAVVAKPMHSAWFERLLGGVRRRLGVATIAPEGALAAARAALADGRSVAMVIDQVPGRAAHGVRGEFLGASAWIDRAPFTLAHRAGVPVVVAAQRRLPDGEHALEVLDVLGPRPGEGAHRFVARAARGATARLDAFVRAHPEAWFWLHRRWREPLEEGRRALPAHAAASNPARA